MAAPISASDVLLIAKSVTAVISRCITATKDKEDVNDGLITLQLEFDSISKDMQQYILSEDDVKIWKSKLRQWQKLIDQLDKILTITWDNAALDRITYACWTYGAAGKQIKALKECMTDLREAKPGIISSADSIKKLQSCM